MTQYDIKRWDVVMFSNSITMVPMIYIKPDKAFIEFAHNNKFAVMVTINSTNTIYDGKKIPGVVDTSGRIPNNRPNYFNKTGYYVITLDANWYGYPSPRSLGTASFFGLYQDSPNLEHNLEKSRDISNQVVKNSDKNVSLDNIQIASIFISIVSTLVLLFLISR